MFTDVAPGISHAVFDVPHKFSGHAFDVDLEKADLHVVPAAGRAAVDALARAFPHHLAVNASFFDEKNAAMGRVVSNGQTLVKDRRAPWGALIVDGKHARVVLGSALPADGGGGDVVVQGIPRLVVGGEVPKLKPASAERTAVCAADTRVTLVVATEADTATFARFLALPRNKGGLGCRDALNLDGGPSTQLDVALPGLTLSVKGGWGVPNALLAVPR